MSGGSKSEKVTLPKFYETALQQQIGMARDASQTGYVPYYGPEVAAFSPMQNAAFQNQNQAMSAFGMAAPSQDAMQGYMPPAQTFGDGVQGYSSAPIYEGAVNQLAANRPAQAAQLGSFGLDPVTGQMGENAASMQPVALEMQASRRSK